MKLSSTRKPGPRHDHSQTRLNAETQSNAEKRREEELSALQQANLLAGCDEALCVLVREAFGVRRISALCIPRDGDILAPPEETAPGYGALQTLRAVRLRLCRAVSLRFSLRAPIE